MEQNCVKRSLSWSDPRIAIRLATGRILEAAGGTVAGQQKIASAPAVVDAEVVGVLR